MALNIKVALLTSLFFIGGMCWMVSQVARPIVEVPTPLVAGMPESASTIAEATRYGPNPMRALARKLSEPSPVDVVPIEQPVFARLDDTTRSTEPVALPQGSLPPLVSRNTALAGAVDPGAASPSLASAIQATSPRPDRSAAIPQIILTGTLEPEPSTLDAVSTQQPVERPGTTALASAKPTKPAKKIPSTTYEIRRGDTLRRIAKRVMGARDEKQIDASVVALLTANPRLSGRANLIKAGEALNVPGLHATQTVATRGSAKSRNRRPARGGKERWYTVRKNDSLAKIARVVLKDERRWPEIAKLNGMRNANSIRPGAKIQLPSVHDET